MSAPEGPDTRGFAALTLGASMLGFAAMLVRWAAPAGPLAVGFYRMAFALPFVAWMARRGGRALPGHHVGEHEGGRRGRGAPGRSPLVYVGGTSRQGTGRARFWALGAGVCFVLDLWTWHSALHLTSAANATLLVTLAPIWVAVVSVLWMGAKLRKRFWLGVLLALSGALVLGLTKGARWGTGLGELLGALASLAYAAFTLALGRARRHLSAAEALFWVVLCGTVGFGLLGWVRGEPFTGFPARTWWALAALGVTVQVVAWRFITWGLGHVPTSLGAMGLMMQPVATIILGWLLLAEAVKPLQGLGALLVLAGIAVCAFTPPAAEQEVTTPA